MALPPGPRAPGIVNALRFARRPLDVLRAWHARYGDVFTVRITGFGTGVYVADPEAIRDLFTGDQSDLLAGEANSVPEPILGPALGAGARRARAPAPAQAAAAAVPGLAGGRRSARSSARWPSARSPAGRPAIALVLRERMRALTFEVICRVVFGVTEAERVERLRAALMAVIDLEPVVLVVPAARAGPRAAEPRRPLRSAGCGRPTRC